MMLRLDRSCVTRPAIASSFRWKESVFGGMSSPSAIVPGVSPAWPVTTSARNTCRRTGCARAARLLTTSVCSTFRVYSKNRRDAIHSLHDARTAGNGGDAGHDPDTGLGVVVLPARDAGGADGPGHGRF